MPSEVSSQLNGPAAAMMMKTVALVRKARMKAALQFFQVMARYTNSPTRSAVVAVIAPASTTPAMPPTTEPTSTTGMMRANEPRSAADPEGAPTERIFATLVVAPPGDQPGDQHEHQPDQQSGHDAAREQGADRDAPLRSRG